MTTLVEMTQLVAIRKTANRADQARCQVQTEAYAWMDRRGRRFAVRPDGFEVQKLPFVLIQA